MNIVSRRYGFLGYVVYDRPQPARPAETDEHRQSLCRSLFFLSGGVGVGRGRSAACRSGSIVYR